MAYLIGWGALYTTVFLHAITQYKGRFFIFLCLLLMAAIASFRGDVGTDTANYQIIIGNLMEGFQWQLWEPGFVALCWLLVKVSNSVELAVRVIAVLFFICMGVYLFRSDKNERFLLLSYLLPVFGWQYSMNALRIGLASVVLLLAVQAARKHSPAFLQKFGLIALSFHYSSIFSLIFLTVAQRRWLNIRFLLLMLALVTIGGVILVLLQGYFLNKLAIYQQMQSPSGISGLRNIVPLTIIMGCVLLGRLPSRSKVKLTILGAVPIAIAATVAQVSYAGLRLLDLISFSFPLVILIAYQQEGLKFSKSTKFGFILAGMLTAVAIWLGFLQEQGIGRSPFLPYEVADVFKVAF